MFWQELLFGEGLLIDCIGLVYKFDTLFGVFLYTIASLVNRSISVEVERGPNAQPKRGKAVPYGFLVVSCICFYCSLSFVLETSAYGVEMAFYSYTLSGMLASLFALLSLL